MECSVYGIVQGVFYRDFVKRTAKKNKIVGTVQNQKDGNVFICAEGEEEDLKTFLEKIRKGSFFSRIEKIEASWLPIQSNFTDFSIVY